jgi:hypothetical protein
MSFGRGCEQYWDLADWVPVDVLVNEWCKANSVCKEAKKAAILSACERNIIVYRRSDGKTWEDPVNELYEKGILLIGKKSFFTWVSQFNDSTAPLEKISTREKENLHAIIGGLLLFLLSEGNRNQNSVICQLTDTFKDIEPFSQRSLEAKFAEARKIMLSKGVKFDGLLLSLKSNKSNNIPF